MGNIPSSSLDAKRWGMPILIISNPPPLLWQPLQVTFLTILEDLLTLKGHLQEEEFPELAPPYLYAHKVLLLTWGEWKDAI